MAITKAVAERRWQQVRLLTELFYDVNSRDHRGYTPLIQTIYIDNERKAIGVAKYLLNHGAKVGITDKQGLNALMHACKEDRERLALLFLSERDFDLNHSDHEGNTALIYTAITGNIIILNKLLAEMKKYKLTTDKANRDGITALIAAAQHGNILCTRILISIGRASVGIRDNKYHRTAKEWETTRTSRDLASKSPLFQLIAASSNNSSLTSSLSSSRSQSISTPVVSTPRRRPRSAVTNYQQSRSVTKSRPNEIITSKKQPRAVSAGPYRRPLTQPLMSKRNASVEILPLRQYSTLSNDDGQNQAVLTPLNKLMLIYQAQYAPSYKAGVKSVNDDKCSGRSLSPASTIDRENSETSELGHSISSIAKRRMSLSRLVGLTRSRRDSTASNSSTSSFSKLAKKALAITRSEISNKITGNSHDESDHDRKSENRDDVRLSRFRSYSDIRYDQEKSEDDKARIRSKFMVKFQLSQRKGGDSNDQENDQENFFPSNKLPTPMESSHQRILAATKLVSLYKETKNKTAQDRKNAEKDQVSKEQHDDIHTPLAQDDTPSNESKHFSPPSSSPTLSTADHLNQVEDDTNIDNHNAEEENTIDDENCDENDADLLNSRPQFTYDTIGAINKFSKQFKIIKDQSKIRFPTVIEADEE
ncbi:Ankyrin repeat domain-containing protein 63 [Trichoplax sp. H2]|nr:Ankyrin repeat domain-containing protein 63 [Trichoplax sp. H2]|eukprot:RDD47912.1 Ankyrin repeat domain-containing protein 63 [Trichoplax sp. H2]